MTKKKQLKEKCNTLDPFIALSISMLTILSKTDENSFLKHVQALNQILLKNIDEEENTSSVSFILSISISGFLNPVKEESRRCALTSSFGITYLF